MAIDEPRCWAQPLALTCFLLMGGHKTIIEYAFLLFLAETKSSMQLQAAYTELRWLTYSRCGEPKGFGTKEMYRSVYSHLDPLWSMYIVFSICFIDTVHQLLAKAAIKIPSLLGFLLPDCSRVLGTPLFTITYKEILVQML